MIHTPRTLRRALAATALVTIAAVAPLADDTATADSARTAPALAAGACGPVIPKGDGTTWTCTFADAFDGTALDTDTWIVQDTRRTGFTVGKTCFTSSPDNVRVRDGHLILVAREGRTINCRSPKGFFSTRYTGGMVGTRGSFSQAYGRFEVRAELPAGGGPGLHGGFWMNPLDMAYGPWPASGEIDVAEWWSSDPTLVLPSLHYNGRDPQADSGWGCRVTDQTAFHTYTLEWLRTVMRFSIDGDLCFARSWTPDAPQQAPQPFDRPFSMILDMAVGPATGTNKVSWRTPFPGSLVVDYARAWR
ncbi:family 16 glycosylhydrolase [Nocardioides sp. MH1]|uniref:glycoside hydrolase family 16 protein n=1 Tax=Nocardioides sp. MH1 TaxID=3242490 RepID=UPI003521B562